MGPNPMALNQELWFKVCGDLHICKENVYNDPSTKGAKTMTITREQIEQNFKTNPAVSGGIVHKIGGHEPESYGNLESSVILVERDHDHSPFVTWVATKQRGSGKVNFVWGNYLDNFETAERNFAARVKESQR